MEDVKVELVRKEEEMEKEVWRCLNSVHDLLRRREVLNQTLRKGWMELVSARYQMGPARISYPLFSLKPQAGRAVVDVTMNSTVPDDNGEVSINGHVNFALQDGSERGQEEATSRTEVHLKLKKEKSSSQLRRRPVAVLADDEKDELLAYSKLISESDSEDDLKPLEVQRSSLQGFGVIVSPHLRAAQDTFSKALQLAIDLLNLQSEALDAHHKLSNLQANTGNLVWD